MSALRDRVLGIIEGQLNPLLAVDRGAVELLEIMEEEGKVLLRYTGRCAGCPGLPITHGKLVTTALQAAESSIRLVEYTLLGPEDV